jgi:hypothetical protein
MDFIKEFLRNEEGFQVFEHAGLMKVGIVLAIIVGSFVVAIVGNEYLKAEKEYVGNEVEAGEALLQRDGQTLTRFR